MVDVDHAVSTHTLSLQCLTLVADFKFVREFFSVGDASLVEWQFGTFGGKMPVSVSVTSKFHGWTSCRICGPGM